MSKKGIIILVCSLFAAGILLFVFIQYPEIGHYFANHVVRIYVCLVCILWFVSFIVSVFSKEKGDNSFILVRILIDGLYIIAPVFLLLALADWIR